MTAVYKPGRIDEFAEWARGATAEAARFPGNLAATVVHDEDSRDFHVVQQFTTRRSPGLLRRGLCRPGRHPPGPCGGQPPISLLTPLGPS
ncbi:hypothetical protein [Amycolatopsis sp. NPDC021455]|uniref:hypothetical protein n=1 Tax=Amycolatopsis sp. NPDC021455 TaxID=3154901 RepID=UPI0033EDF01E